MRGPPPPASRGSSTETLHVIPEVELVYESIYCNGCGHWFTEEPGRSKAKFCRECGWRRELVPPTETHTEPVDPMDISPITPGCDAQSPPEAEAEADYDDDAAPCTEDTEGVDTELMQRDLRKSYMTLEILLHKRSNEPSGIEFLNIDRLKRFGNLHIKGFVEKSSVLTHNSLCYEREPLRASSKGI